MKTKSLAQLHVALLTTALFWTVGARGQTIYSQVATNKLANTWTNLVEKSATAINVATFRNDVAVAWTNDSGGVFDLPTAVSAATTVFRGTYGTNGNKRMQ